MKKYRILITIIPIFILIFILLKSSINTNKPITLHEAYKITEKYMSKTVKNPILLSITSADGDNTENDSGDLGERRIWSMEFLSLDEKSIILLSIKDGKIHNKRTINDVDITKFNNNFLIKKEDIKLDSSDALKICQDRFNLKKGKYFAIGYHFILNKINNNVILTVKGTDEKGYVANILFNANTGELINATRQISTGGGIYKNEMKIKINELGIVSGDDILISPNFSNDKTIFLKYFSNPYSIYMKNAICKSNDGGITWETMNNCNDFGKIFFSNDYKHDNVIFAIKGPSLLKTTDQFMDNEQIFNKDNEQIIDFSNNKEKLVILTERFLNISNNFGKTWYDIKFPQGSSKVLVDSANCVYLIANGTIYKNIGSEWSEIALPNEFSKNIKDALLIDDNIITFKENKILSINVKNNKFNQLPASNNIKRISQLTYQDSVKPAFIVELDNNEIYKYYKGGNNELLNKRLIINTNENVNKIQLDDKDNIFYCTSSKIKLDTMGGK